MKRLRNILLAISVGAIFTAGCSSVPITGRSRLNLVSDSEVLSASLSEYNSFMKSATLSSDKAASAQVVRVGSRIASATEAYLRANGMEEDADGFSWEFNLVRDDTCNAFCMPGGKIVVYDGLLKLVASDDELATVLGHEVAHAVAKHGNERISQQLLASAGSSVLALALMGKSSETQTAAALAFGLGAQYGVLLPFSRTHESEADYMGLALMTMAGYDPSAAVGFWKKMAANGSGSSSEFLSTHPSDERRISDIESALPEIRAKFTAIPNGVKSN